MNVPLRPTASSCGALPKFFDLFYRADHAREHSGDGSGLGLAVVKKAAEQMGAQ